MDGNSTYNDAGDLAITFGTALTESELKADLIYNLTGTIAADTIVGGANADTITGGKGADRLSGGTGIKVDTFVFNTGDGVAATAVTANGSTITFGNGVETITDFGSEGNTTSTTLGVDKMVFNGTTIEGTSAAFLAMRDASSCFNDATPDAAGYYYLQGTFSGSTFTVGATGADHDFLIFNNASTGAISLTGISDIVLHDNV